MSSPRVGHALDEVDPLAPVVERRQRADHRHHGVGIPPVVRRRVGEVLDLADHVVAEEPHDAAVQRRQVVELRAGVLPEQGFERREHPLIGRDAVRQCSVEFDDAVAQHEHRRRVAADEREPRPAFGALDRLEQEAGSIADELDVGGDRRLEIGEQLGPHRDHRVFGGVAVELVAGSAGTSSAGQASGPNDRKKHVRAPVWQAPAPSCSTLNSRASASQS